MQRRAATGRSVFTRGGLALTTLGVVTSLAAWAFGIWMALIGLGVAVCTGSVWRRGIAPRLWTAV